MFYKAKASVIIFVLLIVLLFAISECKRAGAGGGRIFRTTILKGGRRNSRRSRDLYAQQMITSLSVSNRPPDEALQTPDNSGKIPLIYLPYDFIEHKKDYQSAWDESLLQEKNLKREDKVNSRNLEMKNPVKDDEFSNVPNELPEKPSYSLSGYPFGIITNDENKQRIINPLESKYDQTLNVDAIETDHYSININENNFPTNRHNQDVSSLLNVLLGKTVYKDRKIRSLDNFSTKESSEGEPSSNNNCSYHTYNYYNYPKGTPKAIAMPVTRILFCQKDFSGLCTPYTFPLCTSYGTIMCVALEQQLVPCVEELSLDCFGTIAEETQDREESNEEKKTDTMVKLPCVTKVTITADKSIKEATFKRVKKNDMEEETIFCVVTVLIPKAKEEPDK